MCFCMLDADIEPSYETAFKSKNSSRMLKRGKRGGGGRGEGVVG